MHLVVDLIKCSPTRELGNGAENLEQAFLDNIGSSFHAESIRNPKMGDGAHRVAM